MADLLKFSCNGSIVEVDAEPGESLLSVLRERLGLVSVKDGCAPQGQCGCCTVLVDGDARVSCVTPAARMAGRSVETLEGLADDDRIRWAQAFVATGGSQCGFCTPGIIMRAVALERKGRVDRLSVDRALAAHLCRCTGWQPICEAIDCATSHTEGASAFEGDGRDCDAAARRACLEGGVDQRVALQVPQGLADFADDAAPRDALVAVPCPEGTALPHERAAGLNWVVAPTLGEARAIAAKVQGRRSTLDAGCPIALPASEFGGESSAQSVSLRTGWVEPAYLEVDASWCAPGGVPAPVLANGGAFGAKEASFAPQAARELADRFGRTVRVVYAREDTVRHGAKRAPVAARSVYVDGTVRIVGNVGAGALDAYSAPMAWPYDVDVIEHWEPVDVIGPPITSRVRASGIAERAVLLEGALDAAGIDRAALVSDDRVRSVMLDSCVLLADGACAGASVDLDGVSGALKGVRVQLAVGDPLDAVVLRSYAIGAAHMALGWVLTEGISVDAATGEVADLTIRSFGILRAKDMPPIDVVIIDDCAHSSEPLPRGSDAVFAAVAAATWNALARVEGSRPLMFPARDTRTSRALRR